MKKYLIIAIAIAAFCISGVAYALDVSVDGEIAVRGRYSVNGPSAGAASVYPGTGNTVQINGLANSHANGDNEHITYTRFVLDINIQGDGVKGKLALMNDWDIWGSDADRGAMDKYKGYCESGNTGNTSASGSGPVGGTYAAGGNVASGCASSAFIREAWIDFIVPGTPVGVKAGRMLGQLGNGWFLMSEYGGQDAWVLYGNIGKVAQVGFQDVKLSSGTTYGYSNTTGALTIVQTKAAGDVDLYTLFAVAKPSDTATLSFDLSYIHDGAGVIMAPVAVPNVNSMGNLWNLGMSWNVKAGPIFIKGEVDGQQGSLQQFGKSFGNIQYNGYQGIIQAYIPIGIVTVDLGAAYGSGNRPGSSNHSEYVSLLDINQHYTYLYEYRTKTANAAGTADTGLENTMFLEGGLMVAVSKSVAVGFDTFWLGASELASMNGNPHASHDIGVETDAKVNWQIYPNLSLQTQFCWLATGAAYRTTNAGALGTNYVANNGGYMDDIYGIQTVLKLTF